MRCATKDLVWTSGWLIRTDRSFMSDVLCEYIHFIWGPDFSHYIDVEILVEQRNTVPLPKTYRVVSPVIFSLKSPKDAWMFRAWFASGWVCHSKTSRIFTHSSASFLILRTTSSQELSERLIAPKLCCRVILGLAFSACLHPSGEFPMLCRDQWKWRTFPLSPLYPQEEEEEEEEKKGLLVAIGELL